MKWLIGVLIFISIFLGECRNDSYSPRGSIEPEIFYVMPERADLQSEKTDLFEDFEGNFKLNWGILGVDNSHWSLDKVPGSLTITTQDGTFERGINNPKNVFVVDFPAEQSDDFQITTCISNFFPHEFWNEAGLILWADMDNYFKFDYEYGEGPPPNNAPKLLFAVALETHGSPTFGWFETKQTPVKMWLRIIKRDDLYELYNSTDGETFNSMKVILPARITRDNTTPCVRSPLKYIGVFANNGTNRGMAQVNASFDFFEFKTLPKETNEE